MSCYCYCPDPRREPDVDSLRAFRACADQLICQGIERLELIHMPPEEVNNFTTNAMEAINDFFCSRHAVYYSHYGDYVPMAPEPTHTAILAELRLLSAAYEGFLGGFM